MPRDEAPKAKNIRESPLRASSNGAAAIQVVRRLKHPTIQHDDHPELRQKTAIGTRISS